MEMPYNNHYDRVTLDQDGKVEKRKIRDPERVRFDIEVFGEKFY